MTPPPSPDDLRRRILDLVREYVSVNWPARPFRPTEDPVPASGKVFDADDLCNLVDASLDFWLTTGRFAAQFERQFADYIGIRHALLVNSGSSANLVAVSALTSPLLGDRQVKPGDEVITVAAGFPTTVNPILQNGLVPVFVDAQLPTYDLNPAQLEKALSPRTRAIVLAHTLGNPFDVDAVLGFARKHNLWLVEDCCDALGAEYKGRKVGTFGDLATVSFYPAHHITMGEGGAVLTASSVLRRAAESLRDWGRDCWCDPGKDNTCGKRFDWQLGELPAGYDHKYTYSHIGYNLKATDMQAAVGLSQMKKLPDFIRRRRENFEVLSAGLKQWQSKLILPEATSGSNPSWFGFPISVREDAGFERAALIRWLESRKIGTRLLFGGNLLRQPAYLKVPHRIADTTEQSDRIMRQTFWIGLYPGLDAARLDYVLKSFETFFRSPKPA